MEGQSKKFDKEAKKYVGKFASAEDEEKYKQEQIKKLEKIKAAEKEGDSLFEDTNFDEASLSVYGAELGEQVQTGDSGFHEEAKAKEKQKVEILK